MSVIIDGVDVSGCEFFSDMSNGKPDTICMCYKDMYGFSTNCKHNKDAKNCYYKQLKRLQAENERLKEENYQLQKDCQICENFIDCIPCKPLRDMDYDLQMVINQRDNYIQALQEIREIVEEWINNDWSCFHCRSNMDEKLQDILDLIKAEEE